MTDLNKLAELTTKEASLSSQRKASKTLTAADFPEGLEGSRTVSGAEGASILARQEEMLTTTRCGDFLMAGYRAGPLMGNTQIDGVCLCGAPVCITVKTLANRIRKPESAYYSPISRVPHLWEQPSFAIFWCPHVHQELAKEYPGMLKAWQSMKNGANTSLLPKTPENYDVRWFRKDIGLLRFILDVGLPPSPEHVLKKTGKAFSKGCYRWEKDGVVEAPSGNPSHISHPSLYRRYHALKSEARRNGRHLHWDDVESFVEGIRPPPDLEIAPDRYRLQWRDVEALGYTPDNFVWKSTRGKFNPGEEERRQANDPWNLPYYHDELAKVLPYDLLDRLGSRRTVLVIAELTHILSSEDPLPYTSMERLLEMAEAKAGEDEQG